MRRAASLLLALVLVAGACGDDEPDGDATTSAAPSTTTEPPTTTTPPEPPEVPAVDLVLASEAGVVRVAADGRSTVVSDEPAAVAFGLGADLVVFQGGSVEGSSYPPGPEGPVRAWAGGAVRDLPLAPAATRAALLDAGLVDGAPVALVAERFGEVGPDDTFEELVLVDLLDDTRTTLVRRPAWESGHLSARLLPDGDVIGLITSEAQVLLTRWAAGSEEAVWTVEVGVDIRVDLAVLDGQATTVQPSFDEARGFVPMLTLTAYDAATGEPSGPRVVEVVDPEGTIDTGLSCDEWLSPSLLACSRAGGSPLGVSTDDGAVVELPGEPGARPTVVRAA